MNSTESETKMRNRVLMLLTALLHSLIIPSIARAENSKYPPLADYLMARDAEVALARSAAPLHISERATIKVLTASGYEVVREGDNGFVCMVMRGWTAPTYTPV